jgi:hypothetical protein
MRVAAALALAAMVAGTSFLAAPAAQAQSGNAPWCAMVDTGMENISEICAFRSVEECRPFVLAGNRGSCEPNPRYVEPARRHPRKRHVKG